jgi:hypothetical protein
VVGEDIKDDKRTGWLRMWKEWKLVGADRQLIVQMTTEEQNVDRNCEEDFG